MTEYIEVINRILKMPGIYDEFISRNFEVFSKGRLVEILYSNPWSYPVTLAGYAQPPHL